jgi:hypothetical protein
MQQKVNYIVSTILESEVLNGQMPTPEEYLYTISDILCQIDTDLAIKVMESLEERLGDIAKNEALNIKIKYGY